MTGENRTLDARTSPPGTSPAVGKSGRLGFAAMLAYSLPALGAGYMNPTMNMVVMKFSTDVLLIAPAIMGLIFSISRVVDAIIDPIVGYLSDITRSRIGRRRTWVLVSALPLAGSFYMVFSPPTALGGAGLIVWMATAVAGFYVSLTLFAIPHYAWGAELATDYHDRSRLFGFRQAMTAAGSILALLGLQAMLTAEDKGTAYVREVLSSAALIAAVCTAILIIALTSLLAERSSGRRCARPQSPIRSLREVSKNPHARLLFLVYFIENMGFGAVAALTLYLTRYVIERPDMGGLVALAYFIPAAALVTVWIPIARRIGKRKLWLISMVVTALSLGSTVVLPFVSNDVGLVILITAVAFAGAAAGCGAMMAPAILGDVVDHDDHQTGMRKDGTYFAALTFTQKSAYGIMLMTAGFVLQGVGFEPNVDQPLAVQFAMVVLFGLVPLVCYLFGAAVFTRFSLNEDEQRRISAALDRRS
jgi:Na+/melibiose symporter-like transporter